MPLQSERECTPLEHIEKVLSKWKSDLCEHLSDNAGMQFCPQNREDSSFPSMYIDPLQRLAFTITLYFDRESSKCPSYTFKCTPTTPAGLFFLHQSRFKSHVRLIESRKRSKSVSSSSLLIRKEIHFWKDAIPLLLRLHPLPFLPASLLLLPYPLVATTIISFHIGQSQQFFRLK